MQAEHLRLLKGAHAPVRAEHEHANALLAAHGVFGGAAGVAAGGTQDVELLAAAAQFVLEQVAQQLHGHVFESQRGAVGQGFQIKAVGELFQRRDFARAEHLGRVGCLADRLQVSRWNVVDVERQDLERQRGVALGLPYAAQAGQVGRAQLRIALGQVQPAIGRQAFQQDVAKLSGGGVATGGEVVHGGVNRGRDGIAIRVLGAACVCKRQIGKF